MRAPLFAAALIAAPAAAQVVQPNGATLQSQITAAQQKADQAAAAAQAATPPTCATVPATDTATGSMGTGTPCVRAPNASAQTNVMPAQATTIADGSFTGTWPAPFPAAPTTAFASVKSNAEPYLCQVGVTTPSGFTGKCWRLAPMTLPGALAGLLNLVLVPYGAPPTGSTVMVVGRQ